MTRLSELKVGHSGRVTAVGGSDEISSRLLEMGIVPGVLVTIIGEAPLGDPLELELRGYRLSVRRSEADRIDVSTHDDGATEAALSDRHMPRRRVVPSESTASSVVALIGNPNTGKSTLFTALSGVHQRTGNYPGVTVEKKLGQFHHDGQTLTLVDLPGTYSLAPRSPDEMVSVDVLLGRVGDVPRPQVIVCIVDASNLERNMYLVSQVLELAVPTVIALNMIDLARDHGLTVDHEVLERQLGIPVIPLQGNRRLGLPELKEAITSALHRDAVVPESPFPPAFRAAVEQLEQTLGRDPKGKAFPRYLAERLLLDTTGYLASRVLDGRAPSLAQELIATRERLAAEGCPIPAIEAQVRYGWVARVLDGVVRRPAQRKVTWSDRLDEVLTHRVWGVIVFLALMFVVFQSVFRWAEPLMGWVEAAVGFVGETVGAWLPEGPVHDLVVDGIVAGVGGVLVFLPQIMILFALIAVLEDCGYMARAAYLMDRLMTRVGLSGKSFIPLLSSFACAIPGVMAARVIENRRDRLTTILIAPLMSCSARLPVYTLLIGAFIPSVSYLGGWMPLQGLVMMAMYLVGMVAAVAVAWLLKGTVLSGPTPPFVLELPSYKIPSLQLVVLRMLDRGWAFVCRAGTLIVAVSIVVWAALYYPRNPALDDEYRQRIEALVEREQQLGENDPQRAALQEQQLELDHERIGALQRQSYLGQLGHVIEPAVKPLGWDWRIGCAAIASFPAREVVVATLGIIYNLGSEVSDDDLSPLHAALRDAEWEGSDPPRKVFNIPVALSIMVFFALCAQCASTLVVIRRETNSWGWAAFTFLYMTLLAYLAALVTYQVGMLI